MTETPYAERDFLQRAYERLCDALQQENPFAAWFQPFGADERDIAQQLVQDGLLLTSYSGPDQFVPYVCISPSGVARVHAWLRYEREEHE